MMLSYNPSFPWTFAKLLLISFYELIVPFYNTKIYGDFGILPVEGDVVRFAPYEEWINWLNDRLLEEEKAEENDEVIGEEEYKEDEEKKEEEEGDERGSAGSAYSHPGEGAF